MPSAENHDDLCGHAEKHSASDMLTPTNNLHGRRNSTNSIKESIRLGIKRSKSAVANYRKSLNPDNLAHDVNHYLDDDNRTAGSLAPPNADGNDGREGDVKVPMILRQGTPLLKISPKKVKVLIFWLDADIGEIRWESKKKDGGRSTALLFLSCSH